MQENQRTALAAQDHGPSERALSRESRETSQIRSLFVLALERPRVEEHSFAALQRTMRISRAAEGAQYRFPRGGEEVSGPSVDFAREAARCWGHVQVGLDIVESDRDWIQIRATAIDSQTGTKHYLEDRFRNAVQRKKTPALMKRTAPDDIIEENDTHVWIRPDERDQRELIFRRGAILERNVVLKILPEWYVAGGIDQAEDTRRKSASGELDKDRSETVRTMIGAFDRLGVRPEQLAAYLGHAVADITPGELARMRAVHNSIRDGQSTIEDHFDLGKNEGAAEYKKAAEEMRKPAAAAAKKPAPAQRTVEPDPSTFDAETGEILVDFPDAADDEPATAEEVFAEMEQVEQEPAPEQRKKTAQTKSKPQPAAKEPEPANAAAQLPNDVRLILMTIQRGRADDGLVSAWLDENAVRPGATTEARLLATSDQKRKLLALAIHDHELLPQKEQG